MPISHRLQTIFIHVPKTGGSSIEQALDLLPPDDPTGLKPNTDCLFGRTESGYLQHMPLWELIENGLIGEAHQHYFKFAFVRNPWDRVVSEYFYDLSYKRIPEIDFDTFVREVVTSRVARDQHFFEQHRFCIDGSGRNCLDFIGRFENLQGDFDHVCDRLGVPSIRLPHIRKREHYFYPDYYTSVTSEIVAEVCKLDIELFGYEFESFRWGKRLSSRLAIDARKLVRSFQGAEDR